MLDLAGKQSAIAAISLTSDHIELRQRVLDAQQVLVRVDRARSHLQRELLVG